MAAPIMFPPFSPPTHCFRTTPRTASWRRPPGSYCSTRGRQTASRRPSSCPCVLVCSRLVPITFSPSALAASTWSFSSSFWGRFRSLPSPRSDHWCRDCHSRRRRFLREQQPACTSFASACYFSSSRTERNHKNAIPRKSEKQQRDEGRKKTTFSADFFTTPSPFRRRQPLFRHRPLLRARTHTHTAHQFPSARNRDKNRGKNPGPVTAPLLLLLLLLPHFPSALFGTANF